MTRKYTEETKSKMSNSHADISGKNHPFYGKHLSGEHKRKISISSLGKYVSEETKNKISINHKGMEGKHHTEETKKKISVANIGRFVSEETRKKRSIANTGKFVSEETKKKIGDANRGKIRSEETKNKIRIAMGLTEEIMEQRLEDVRSVEKVWGWKTRIAEKWGLSTPAVRKFIKKYVSENYWRKNA